MKKIIALSLVFTITASIAEPLAEFEIITKKCQKAHDIIPNEEVVFMENIKAWVKRARLPTKVIYDVKRTDSLVNPYIATLEYSVIGYADRGTDKENAQAIPIDLSKQALKTTNSLTFAYRDKSWQIQNNKKTTEYKTPKSNGFERPTFYVADKDTISDYKDELSKTCMNLI